MDAAARPAPDHPNPTFARPRWVSLDGAWRFATGTADDRPLEASYDRTITVPFPPESSASGIGEPRCEHPRYRRTFTAEVAPGRRLLLHCEGVDHAARVWVNGHLVGSHTGGYTPFVVDVTDALAPGENELVVAASDLARDLEVPRGKQDWHDEPHIIWYGRSSGIWRSVWLEEVPAVRLDAVSWTTLDTFGRLHGEVRLHGFTEGSGLLIEASFAHQGTHLATASVEATGAAAELTVRLGTAVDADTPALYWSPENPALIDVSLRLLRGDEVIDEVAGYTGLRTVEARDGAILLGGVAQHQRLVLEQAYWPATHFTAPSLEDLRAEASLILGLGFNGLRMHQVSADPRFLRACDEIGLQVWADVPASYVFSARSVELATRTLTELIGRDRNHPSVIAWVPYNESWGVSDVAGSRRQRDAVRALASLARALDPTRLVIGNDGWENVTGDVIGVHDYTHDADVLAARYGTPDAVAAQLAAAPRYRRLLVEPFAPDTPVLLSEFGGVSLPSGAEHWGYGHVPDAAALVAQVRALVHPLGPGSGVVGFCWTQLTDTLQEQNGLAWPDRRPKAPLDELAAAIRGEPAPD